MLRIRLWALEGLAEVYTFLYPLYNYGYPPFKRVSKEKQSDRRYKNIYEKKARTPYERPVASPDSSEECKAELRRDLYNPVELNRGVKQGRRETLETKP